jgi:hypothetical protein
MRQRLLLAAALLASTAFVPATAADPPAAGNRQTSVAAHQASVPVVLPPGPVELGAGTWRTWVIASGGQYRLPPPPGAEESRGEIEQLRALAGKRDPMTLDRIGYWDTGAPSYRWNLILIATSASLAGTPSTPIGRSGPSNLIRSCAP